MKRLAVTIFGLLLLSLAGGCGGGGGAGEPNVSPEVQVLPTDGTVAIVGQTDTSVTLSGQVPQLQPGSVMVSAAGQGLLRKVVSVSEAGGEVQVETIQGTLEDVFDDADLQFSKTLAPGDIESVTPLVNGVTVLSAPAAARQDAFMVELTLDNIVLYGTQDAGVVASGTLRLKLEVNLQVQIRDGKLERFLFEAGPTVECEATVTARNTAELPLLKRKIAQVQAAPIVFFAGPVPVVVVPVTELFVHLKGKVEVGMKLSVVASVGLRLGAQYSGGAWTPVAQPTYDVRLPQGFVPDPFVKFSAEASPASFRTSLMIYAVAGPYVTVDSPYVEGSLTITPVPRKTAEIDLAYGIRAGVGAHVAVLGRTLANYEHPTALDLKFRFTGFPKQVPLGGDVGVDVN